MKCKKCGVNVEPGIHAFSHSANQCEGCGVILCERCIEDKNSFTKSGTCPFCGDTVRLMRD